MIEDDHEIPVQVRAVSVALFVLLLTAARGASADAMVSPAPVGPIGARAGPRVRAAAARAAGRSARAGEIPRSICEAGRADRNPAW